MNGDLISRQAAVDEVREHRAMYCDNTPEGFSKLPYEEKCRVDEIDTMWALLVNLPAAEPTEEQVKEYCRRRNLALIAGEDLETMRRLFLPAKPRTGEWLDGCGGMACSCCGFSCDDPYYLGEANYCPNCGARMTEESK